MEEGRAVKEESGDGRVDMEPGCEGDGCEGDGCEGDSPGMVDVR